MKIAKKVILLSVFIMCLMLLLSGCEGEDAGETAGFGHLKETFEWFYLNFTPNFWKGFADVWKIKSVISAILGVIIYIGAAVGYAVIWLLLHAIVLVLFVIMIIAFILIVIAGLLFW